MTDKAAQSIIAEYEAWADGEGLPGDDAEALAAVDSAGGTSDGGCLCCWLLKRFAEARAEREAWRELTAVICGDGGHYHQEYGTAATLKHCIEKFHAMRCVTAEYTTRLAAAEQAAQEAKP